MGDSDDHCRILKIVYEGVNDSTGVVVVWGVRQTGV